jgi:hypothetical protein
MFQNKGHECGLIVVIGITVIISILFVIERGLR